MTIESTVFTIADENANEVEQGQILDLAVRVHRKIEFNSGLPDHTYFAVHFRRDHADDDIRWDRTKDDDIRWDRTKDESGMGAMSDSHVIATRKAADYVREHYGTGVDLGQLE